MATPFINAQPLENKTVTGTPTGTIYTVPAGRFAIVVFNSFRNNVGFNNTITIAGVQNILAAGEDIGHFSAAGNLGANNTFRVHWIQLSSGESIVSAQPTLVHLGIVEYANITP